MGDIENKLGTINTMNAGMEEETQCQWNWRDSAFFGFLFIIIFLISLPSILRVSKKTENRGVEDQARHFHFEERLPLGFHLFQGKLDSQSFAVSIILIVLLGSVICLIFARQRKKQMKAALLKEGVVHESGHLPSAQ